MCDQEVGDGHAQLQGTWQLIGGEKSGKPFLDVVTKDIQLVFADGQMTTKNGKTEFSYPFKLVPDLSPSAIDLIMNESVGKGIFRLESDRLTIVHTEAGEPRPTTFDTQDGSKLTMLILEKLPSKRL